MRRRDFVRTGALLAGYRYLAIGLANGICSVRTLRWRSEEIPDLSTLLFASHLPRRTRKLPPW
jgi:hypothetical protein